MKTILATSILAILPLAVDAQDLAGLPAVLADKVTVARQACGDFKNGEFVMEWGAVTRTDLDGDLAPDWVLDESAFACSTAVSLFCSTGGCTSHFLVGDDLSSFRNQGWTVLTFLRDRVLLARVHGTACGDSGSTPCFIARVWDRESKAWQSAETKVD